MHELTRSLPLKGDSPLPFDIAVVQCSTALHRPPSATDKSLSKSEYPAQVSVIMAGRKAPPSKVLNTLVFIKPLTSLQQKDAQTNEHKIYTGKISNKEVDPHAMSDYVLKHDNYIEYSDDESPKAHAADETENDSVKASPEDNPGGDRQQPKKKARADDEDPDFALYCSAKFILNEDEDNEDEEATEKTDQKEDSNLNDETIDTAAMVLSNEIITSGRACTVDLDTEKRLLQSLANSLHLQYEMENVFFQNEYMIK